MNWSVLVIEGDASIRLQVAEAVARRGLMVHTYATAAEARAALPDTPSVVVLDAGLPGGLQLCTALQSHAARTPVILLSTAAGEDDVLRGFEAGADDYIVRPFSVPELVARIMAQLRHIGLRQPAPRFHQAA